MYHVSLINLAADAHSVASSAAPFERTSLTGPELRTLLQSFIDIDAVQNAVAEPEIRVKVRNESYLIRTGQKKLMLYDVIRRDLPAVVLTLDEAMAELDGSAQAARDSSLRGSAGETSAGLAAPALPVPPVTEGRKPRWIGLGVAVVLLLGGIGGMQWGRGSGAIPSTFQPLSRAEAAGLQASLPGVYLTGNQAGQHGIAVLTAEKLKLFELEAIEAPRIVYASGELGRIGSQLVLATDQPGGVIEVTDRDTLVYCGEVYRRVR